MSNLSDEAKIILGKNNNNNNNCVLKSICQEKKKLKVNDNNGVEKNSKLNRSLMLFCIYKDEISLNK